MGLAGQYDVIVVGGGVVGLAHAWRAADAGKRVALFERSPAAQGASVRNFGMIWPLGQPRGRLRDTAMRSRELWLELSKQAGFWSDQCGSLFLIRREDEKAVGEEFLAAENQDGFASKWLTPAEVVRHSPAARVEGLQGGLYSPTEVGVNPREAIRSIPKFLQAALNVELHFDELVMQVESGAITTARHHRYSAEQIIVCGGHDTKTLFPQLLDENDVYECKLQMLRTIAQPDNWRVGPHLAGGLTMQHYASFADCPSLPRLKQRVAEEAPELNTYGIHVMVSQNQAGEAILGDSHVYREQVTPFDSEEIDRLILRELERMLELPSWTIGERWHGVYAKHAARSIMIEQPLPDVYVVLLPGGAGMTLSMGVADAFWQNQQAGTATDAKV